MRPYEIMKQLSHIIGGKNAARLQMWLKYQLSFKKYYAKRDLTSKTIVFMVDGKTRHGGLSDRLRGLFSTYYYCQQKGYKFKIAWNYPFLLQDYLYPANENWIAEDLEAMSDKRIASFRFFNSYVSLRNREYDYFRLLDSKKPITHVYSNFTLREDLFHDFFRELFVPSLDIQNTLSHHLSILGTHFYSMTFRFIALLGDFKDADKSFHELETESVKKDYITHCLNAIRTIYNKMSLNGKIFVTSDSLLFLSEAAKIPYVYIIHGKVKNIDVAASNDKEAYKKMFIDFLMISKAERIYSYQYGKMYAATGFAKTAALIGGKKCETIIEKK